MPLANTRNGTSEAAVFARLMETENGAMSAALARFFLKLGFSEQEKERMHELAVKNQEGRISSGELEELDCYIRAGDLLAVLQSKARKLLRKRKIGKARHG
jgi:hypothetical protein